MRETVGNVVLTSLSVKMGMMVRATVGRAVRRPLTVMVGEMENESVAGMLPEVREIVGEAIKLIDAGSVS
jgi:hypothetical protein